MARLPHPNDGLASELAEFLDDGHLNCPHCGQRAKPHSMYAAEFILAPPSAWVEREAQALVPRFGDDAYEAVRAAHFAAYLDRRTPLPLLADLRFHLALFRAARQRGLIHECSETQLRSGLCGQGLEVCGFADPLFVRASCDEVAELITQETESFAKKENLHGSTLVSRTRGLFPDPVSTPAQHCFDFVVA